jgi:hypothetical protein
MSDSWPVVILGGTGYVAGEMLRLVICHPKLALAASVSTSQAGTPIAAVFPHLAPAMQGEQFVDFDAALALIELILTLVDAVDRAHVHTGPILHPNASLDDDVRHATTPLVWFRTALRVGRRQIRRKGPPPLTP